MDILDFQTVVVYNHADLNIALSVDNGYIYVHLGTSFAMTAGIRIHPNKPSLLISGIDPRDPVQTVHTLTDFDSNADTGCLHINAASSVQIEFRNLNMLGRNYYGMPCIFDITANAAVSVSYYNISYTGPQIIWNPRGLTRFIDCDINIEPGYSAAHEVGEVNRVEIGGVTTMRQNTATSTNPVFYFYNRNGSSLTILEDADVTINTVNDFFTSETAMPAVIQARAKLTLTTEEGISTNTTSRFSSFHLQEDSVFNYKRTTNSGNANSLFMSGPLTLDKGADFMMIEDVAGSTGALLYFYTTASSINLNSPKRFALYNNGTSESARPFYFSTTTGFNFNGNQINYWNAATPLPIAGIFDDKAPLRWRKPQWEIFNVTGTAGNNGTTVTSTDLTPEELNLLPDLINLQLRGAKVFSTGVLPLTVNRVVGDMRPVTGTSLPASDIQVTYTLEAQERLCSGSCGTTGTYSVDVLDAMPANTSVNVESNIQFLLTDIVVLAADAGDLTIYEAPVTIYITFDPVYNNPVILPRTLPSVPVIISDERVDVDRIQWVLWAKIDGHLRTDSGFTLPESVVFIRKGETTPITLSEQYIDVHTDGPFTDVFHTIEWDIDNGVLARITAPIRVGERYTANLTWLVLPLGTLPEGM